MRSASLHSILLLACILSALAFYDPAGSVSLLTPQSFQQKIRNSKHASIVEFFAPWCGHCKQFAPVYKKAAEHMAGIFTFAAVDCDEAGNRALCAEFGIQGFPTVKLMKPVNGKLQTIDYTGPRTAKGLTDFAKANMENLVVRLTEENLSSFLEQQNDTAKAIMFSKKGPTSALWKSLAIEFQGKMILAQARDTQAAVIKEFNVDTFPSMVVLPSGSAPRIVYSGKLERDPLYEFLSQHIVAPKPSVAPTLKKEIDYTPPQLYDIADLREHCFGPSGICYLLLSNSLEQIKILTAVNARISPAKTMRMYTTEFIRPDSLIFGDETVELIALNSKRKWYKRFEGAFTEEKVLAWMDSVKMGEGKKFVIPSEDEIVQLAAGIGRKVVRDPGVNRMEVDEEKILKEEKKDEQILNEDKKDEKNVMKEGQKDEEKLRKGNVKGEAEVPKEQAREGKNVNTLSNEDGIKEVFGDEPLQKHDEL